MSSIGDKYPTMKTQKIQNGAQVCLRILTIATTLAATWLVFTDKQTIEIFGLKMDARYSYSPAFKFFAYANVIACVFSALSLLTFFIICRQGSKPNSHFFLFLHDLLMMAMVLAGCAAATAIGYVGQFGNSHIGWLAICDHFGKFCHKLICSIALSFVSVLSLLALTIMSAVRSRHIQA
ncbi:CASP-like protein 1F1 [Tripterygium wilfordii]|uniref:CASP-like protein 1F1 n=1 Tax=Tripterygium wilfordii TaxID=458696 RepID=UPI0018F7FBF0|nr:CASP-like protein 1F1 [Tripterygium wilfordii]